jgi:hypothetical protein
MPAYKTNEREFVGELAAGETPLTQRFDQIFKSPEIAAAHPHWAAFCEPGHFDAIDEECWGLLGMMGSNPQVRAHVADWPHDQLEQIRQALVAAIKAGKRTAFRWTLIDGPDDETVIEVDEIVRIELLCSREKAIAFLKAHGLPEGIAREGKVVDMEGVAQGLGAVVY